MKKILFIQILCFLATHQISMAQNTYPWPSNDNVGIGILSPLTKLRVYHDYGYGNSGDLTFFGGKDSWNLNDWEGMRLGFTQFRSVYEGNSLWGLGIRTGTSDGVGSEAIRIGGNGNIGIATASPAAKLHIGQSNQEIRFDYNGTNNYYGSLRWSGVQFGNNGANRIVAGRTATGGLLDFYVNNTNEGADYTVTPNGILAMRINNDGSVGIGTTTPDSKLTVAGNIHSREVKVSVNAGADFVFENGYELQKLEELEKYIQTNKHLPEIASAQQMIKNGLELGDMNIKLLQKIEELTLHLIEQNKKLALQGKQLNELQSSNNTLAAEVRQLKLKP